MFPQYACVWFLLTQVVSDNQLMQIVQSIANFSSRQSIAEYEHRTIECFNNKSKLLLQTDLADRNFDVKDGMLWTSFIS